MAALGLVLWWLGCLNWYTYPMTVRGNRGSYVIGVVCRGHGDRKASSEIVRSEIISNWQFWLTLAGVTILSSAAASFISGYFKKKGEDYATQQALAKITRIVEEVKSELQARQTLRFAALDKRLQAHQEAFGLYRRALQVIHQPAELESRIATCLEWYNDNGLYLEPSARTAFWSAYYATLNYRSGLRREPYDPKGFKEDWTAINSALSSIAEAVGLPPLRDEEVAPPDPGSILKRDIKTDVT